MGIEGQSDETPESHRLNQQQLFLQPTTVISAYELTTVISAYEPTTNNSYFCF